MNVRQETPSEDETKPAEADPLAETTAEDGNAEPGAKTAEPAAEDEMAGVPPATARPGPKWLPGTVKGRVVVAAVLAVLIALLGGGWYWYQSTHLPEGVAFRVYGEDVTGGQLDADMQTSKALYGYQPPTSGPRLDEFRRDFAKAQAVSAIISKAAEERNIAVADRQASDVLTRYIVQFYGEGTVGHDRYVQALADQGTSEPKVLAEIKRQMALRELTTQITAGVQVSDEELRQAFDERRAELAMPERRAIQNIVLRDRADADQVVAALAGGTPFEQLARERSADDATKNEGGNLGLLSARQLQDGYAAAAFTAPVNAVFGPVQTSYGWNVGKVVQVQPPAPAEFDKISDQLRQLLIREKSIKAWNDFLGERIKDAHVLYADEFRPADPDALPSAAPPPDAAGQQPGDQAPAGQAPAGQAPADQAPAGPASAGQAPADQAPIGQAPTGQAPAGQPTPGAEQPPAGQPAPPAQPAPAPAPPR